MQQTPRRNRFGPIGEEKQRHKTEEREHSNSTREEERPPSVGKGEAELRVQCEQCVPHVRNERKRDTNKTTKGGGVSLMLFVVAAKVRRIQRKRNKSSFSPQVNVHG